MDSEKNGTFLDNASRRTGSIVEVAELTQLGYKPELRRNRSMLTLLFQSLAIAVCTCPYIVAVHMLI